MKKKYARNIFKDGGYTTVFNPESSQNPFRHLYKKKCVEVTKFIELNDDFLRILDIGCGMARIGSALNSSPQRSLICADISFDMLRMGRTRCRSKNTVAYAQADAHHLPFEDHSFDCVVALDLFCHLEDPRSTLQEFHRILTDQGLLVIDSTNGIPLWAFFYPRYVGFNPVKWLRLMALKGVLPGWEGIVTHYTKNQFFEYLSRAQFKISRSLSYGPRICPKWHLAIAKKAGSNKL
jgi:glycogen(starch) synthase